MSIFLTETYACQTCFIPITDYFRAFARRWLPISVRLICNQYISQYAPRIRPLSKLTEKKMPGGMEHRTGMYTLVRKNSSTIPMTQLPSSAALRKRPLVQVTCVTSVFKAIGSPKDHIAYCSIPGTTDLSPTCGEIPGFSKIASRHTNVCNDAQKIQTSAKSAEISVNPVEPLRYFEPYTIST